ncbi:hypothetical protein [Flammeovirga kamogawensis]|uniref:Glycoside hydrolase family 42 N-terminal domain-containing protein n=1 Tax=Flammeovirga kamogawensis TaxID=373891 RepID=A0ABX8H3N8_9BACT|nr:hypothetical protein [Flammeovirga kamogawensis]MBB6460477.1 hypothetical protein [Flammeovirga kamogawensis]QWG10283.1 hypothetical protein KM029_21610 [Flammeovirga kamogawensis]TRX64731.1 hypothetical protein EO216_19530 [Flammeovirga kamogawensis]
MNKTLTHRSFYIFSLVLLITTLSSFYLVQEDEDIISLTRLQENQFTTENIVATTSNEGLSIFIKKGEKGEIIFYPNEDYWDITTHKFISIELQNNSTEIVRFDPVISYDNPRRKIGNSKKHKLTNKHIGFINPKETLVYNCVLIRDKVTVDDYPQAQEFPGMKGIPGGVILNFAGVDAKHIKGIKIEFPSQEFEQKLMLKRIFKHKNALPELYTKDKTSFFPFINKYGQYKHGEWAGKITNDEQFKEAIDKEALAFKKYTGSKEWNQYGGFSAGPRYEATGSFRTQKINNKWWLIDPTGHLFWSTGINGAGKLSVSTPINKREHFFEGLPNKDSEEGKRFYKKGSYNHGAANLYRKYGENSELKYTEISLQRMKNWGLNTLGGWSVENINEFEESKRLPYTVIIHETSPEINDKFPDVFDPQWEINLEEKLKKKLYGKGNDPFLFGIYINNEIHWGTPNSIASNVLSKGKLSYAKQEYIHVLREKLKTIEAFNALVGTTFESWKELAITHVDKKDVKWSLLEETNTKYYTLMCETYFQISKKLVSKYAPNKMYIGCRWHGNHKNGINTKVGAKYLDLLSFNAYENEVEFYPHPSKEIDKPFIISEFNFGALDAGKFFTGLGYASTQRNRGEKYVNFVQGALRNPKCVGVHWFMWANSTTAGKGNGENANCGVVSMTDQIYYELVGYMRKINYHIYNYRTGVEL